MARVGEREAGVHPACGRPGPQDRAAPGLPPSAAAEGEARLTRRSLLGLAIAGAAGGLLPGAQPAAARTAEAGVLRRRPAGRAPLEPQAGRWRTWLLSSTAGVRPPKPPGPGSAVTRREIAELLDLQAQRSDAVRLWVAGWDPAGGVPAWCRLLLDAIRETRTDPVLAARAIALLQTAVADTAIAVWSAKYAYDRPAPTRRNPRLVSLSGVDPRLPSYPSEHAAVAAAAATLLTALFPGYLPLLHGRRTTFDAAANDAALSRLWAGAAHRSDIEAGMLLGRAVAFLAVQRAAADGSTAVWDPVAQPGRPSGPAHWVPTPPGFLFPPLHPLAGTWDPWLLAAGDQFRSPVPPALEGEFPGERFLREVLEVKETVDRLTPERLQIARYWADDPGATATPPGHWLRIAVEQVEAAGLSAPRAARALALLGAGLADSAIACWETKYRYWVLRPVTAIRTLAGQPFYQPDFLTPIVTPPFPAYTSGHATFSGCSARVLEHLFPNGTTEDAFGESVSFEAAAEQAAESRILGGIHYRSDSEAGLECGRRIAELVVSRARSDGAR